MFLFLSALSSSAVVEIANDNLKQIIGGEKPAFVKFYSPTCGHCKAMAPDFEEASGYTNDVVFGGVECTSHKDICEKFKIEGYPTIHLFKAKSTTPKEFQNRERSSDGFLDFLEEELSIKTSRPPKVLLDLNPVNFNKTIEGKCALVTFFAPWCGHCKHFLPEAKKAAIAFMNEPNVTIARIDCEAYKGLCSDYDVHGFPTIRLYKDGKNQSFEGDRSAANVMAFMNKNCGTQRGLDGLPNDEAGIINEIQATVAEFIAAEESERPKLLELARKIEGSIEYIRAMERYIKNGPESIPAAIATMENTLAAKKSSARVLDGIKRRINVFRQFIPKPVQTQPEEAEEKKEEVPPKAEEAPKAEETVKAEEAPKAEEAAKAEEAPKAEEEPKAEEAAKAEL